MSAKEKIKKTVGGAIIIIFTAIVTLIINDKYDDYVHSTDVVLSYGGHILDEDKPVDVYVGAGTSVKGNDMLLVPVNFSVKNSGDKPLSDIRLTYHYNDKSFCPPEFVTQFVRMHGNVIKDDVSFEPRYDESGCEMAYALKRLNAGSDFYFPNALAAKHVIANRPYLGELPFAGEITVDVDASGVKRKTYRLKFHLVSRSNIEGLLSWYLNEHVKEKAIRDRPDYSYIQYLKGVIFSSEITSILIVPPYAPVTDNNTQIWLPRDSRTEARIAIYRPYSWSLL